VRSGGGGRAGERDSLDGSRSAVEVRTMK